MKNILLLCAAAFALISNLKGEEMKVIFIAGEASASATLRDCASARDFYSRLPLTMSFSDYAGHEKTARLSPALDTSGAPKGSGAEAGEIGYFAPWNNLVLYYGHQDYYPGIVILGRFDGDFGEILKSSKIRVAKGE